MSNETKNLEELKAAALAATPGPWGQLYDDVSGGDDSLITCDSRDGMIEIAKVEGGGPESGFDEPFRTEQQANARYIAAANPAALLVLITELESAQQRIAELGREVTDWKQRAEHFEGRFNDAFTKLATPVRLRPGSIWNSDPYNHGANDKYLECAAAVRAAGFKVEGDA